MQFAGGSPLYVINKMKWLESRGWEVIVFDHYGALQPNKDIDLPELMDFRKNRYLELFFPPSYFSKMQRESLIDKIVESIGMSDDYIVESNSSRLALWGELLALRLGAKHLIMDVNEHPSIRNVEEFKYFDYKLSRNELFFISSQIVQSFFDGYKQVEVEEADKHVFTAYMDTQFTDVRVNELDKLPDADFKILIFGRYKPFFANVIEDIMKFARNNIDRKINLVFVGDEDEAHLKKMGLNSTENLNYYLLPSMRPIPKHIFEYSDIVIAAAGCATRAYESGAKTIVMSVATEKPLGIMGYTTLGEFSDSDHATTNMTVKNLLEDELLYHKFDGKPLLLKKENDTGFEYQLSLANKNRLYWNRVANIAHDKSKVKIFIQKFLLRLNLINLLVKKIR